MVQNFNESPRDRYAHERRSRVRLEVRPARLQIAGYNIRSGAPAEILVPQSMVPMLKDMVADEQKIAAAQTHFEQEHAEWCKDNTPESSPMSLARSYRTIWRADIPPLRSLEVVEDDLDPPLTLEEKRALAVAQATASASAGKSRRGSKG
jgi:hypothetical protein